MRSNGWPRASSRESGLRFNDNLAIVEQSTSLPCPAWAADNMKLKRVVTAKLLRKVHAYRLLEQTADIPTSLDFVRELEKRALSQVYCPHSKQWKTHREATQRNSGPATLLTAIAFRRFRLGQTSTVIAESLGISPQVVRRQAAGLAEIARRLYPNPELHLPRKHNSKTVTRPYLGGAALTQVCNTEDISNGEPTHAGV